MSSLPLRVLPGLGLALLLLQTGCEEPPPDPDPNPLEAIPQTEEWNLPCLDEPVHVVRTEFSIPHIYAGSRKDLACAQGFVTARDRFFQMDLIARNGLGTLAEVLGDAGLDSDIAIRARGGRAIAEQMVASASETEHAAWVAYADGVNHYIDEVRAGRLPAPSELELVYVLMGAESPADLMDDWTPLQIAGVGSTVNFESGFETTDISNQSRVEQLEDWGTDLLNGELRHEGAVHDIWENIVPVYPVDSSAGFDTGARSTPERQVTLRSGPRVERETLNRALANAERLSETLGHGSDTPGWGSNTWAVAPDLTADGAPLLAGDGHLALTSPAYLYQVHLDTALLGGGDTHAIGLTVAGAPMLGLGTNGNVSWSHTNQTSDINDYYRDEVVLAADGRPAATLFQGEEIPLQEVVETYHFAGVLGGTEGSTDISRWVTGQGRPFFSLEGTVVESAGSDDAAVNVFGDWIVAGDTDGDGRITAVTAAATHYFERHMIEHIMGWVDSRDVLEWGTHLEGMTSYSQHFNAADIDGNILYAAFQAMPCRGYLPREADGRPVPGAHPQLLIDGTQYPSFEVLYDSNKRIDPAKDSPTQCTLSWDEYPHALNPEQGYVMNSNNAPWSAAWDNNIWNEPLYLGGPWYGTWRGSRIVERIQQDAGAHTIETMASIHADHKSRMATEFLPTLLAAMDSAEVYVKTGGVAPESPEERISDLYLANQTALEEATDRLRAWQTRGLNAASGVETVYNSPSEDDQADAVATMIFNAWMGRFLGAVFDDEGLPSLFRPTGSYGRTRALKSLLDGVGPNGAALASLDPATGESVFFDVLGTDVVESAEELAVTELVNSLTYLAEPFGGDRSGGFNTTDQSQWLWGLKHFVKMESFISREMSGEDIIGDVFGPMNITPEVLPLSDPEPGFGDPRRGLPGFPRPGDAFAVDAAGSIETRDFSYGSGPVMRMVFSMKPDGVEGINILPGGQVADPDSEHFADQAALWIANEAAPVRFHLDDVISHANGRELLTP